MRSNLAARLIDDTDDDDDEIVEIDEDDGEIDEVSLESSCSEDGQPIKIWPVAIGIFQLCNGFLTAILGIPVKCTWLTHVNLTLSLLQTPIH